MFYSLQPTSVTEEAGEAMSSIKGLSNGGVTGPASASSRRSLISEASTCAGQAYSATVKALQPLGDAVVGVSKDAHAWSKQGGAWRTILLLSAAGVLACIAGALLALIATTVTVGSSLLVGTALLGLGALATFLVALSGFAILIFGGSVLAAAAIIGAVATAAVVAVVLASLWVLGAWAVYALAVQAWSMASGLVTTKNKKIETTASVNGQASWNAEDSLAGEPK